MNYSGMWIRIDHNLPNLVNADPDPGQKVKILLIFKSEP